jgi:hypothetical protein
MGRAIKMTKTDKINFNVFVLPAKLQLILTNTFPLPYACSK